LALQAVPTSCSLFPATIGAIGTPRPGDNTFLFSWGRWKSGSAMDHRRLGPGDVVLADDLTGQGHTDALVGSSADTVPLWRWC